MDKLIAGTIDSEQIQWEIEKIKENIKTPLMLYFDSMATAARFFNLPTSTVKSAVHRGTSMRNGYKISKIDVLYNLEEKRGLHLNQVKD